MIIFLGTAKVRLLGTAKFIHANFEHLVILFQIIELSAQS